MRGDDAASSPPPPPPTLHTAQLWSVRVHRPAPGSERQKYPPCHPFPRHAPPPSPRPLLTGTVFIAMSSGVDSTVTAHLLLQSGHPPSNLIPFHITSWSPPQHPPSPVARRVAYNKPLPAHLSTTVPPQPCTDADLLRVQHLCTKLSLPPPLHLRLERDYWHAVFTPMLDAYAAGATPNPDVRCNRHVKFGAALFSRLEALAGGARWWVATGHYARVAHTRTGEAHLLRSPAAGGKDQSYFLSTVPQAALQRVLFPLGAARLSKPEVRATAEAAGLLQAVGEESFGLCFVPSAGTGGGGGGGSFREFLEDYLEPNPGEIVVAETGEVVGRHSGLWSATVGEKAGLQLPQGEERWAGRWYVVGKDVGKNRILVGRGEDGRIWNAGVEVAAGEWWWVAGEGEVARAVEKGGWVGAQVGAEGEGEQIWAAYRHGPPTRVKTFRVNGDGSVRIEFVERQRAVVAGQAAAVWVGERCVGGGVIGGVI
ncbi:tRNA-specific 2-thiouridylase [Geopyxis carbonaria]|nr:tRNA-specific 2-thiouridylase [Geopyxis carbonaria]